MTLLELVIALAILFVALGLYAPVFVGTSRMRTVNRENGRARNAARVAFERMRGADFSEVYALYNADGSDDPDGPGTAPGPLFDVPGLSPPEGVEACGSIRLPELQLPRLVPAEPAVFELREDFVDAGLGMPRDLNADSIIDALDHSQDYFILPVQVVIEWDGQYGPRRLEFFSQLCEFRD